jgi:hypothetical protein
MVGRYNISLPGYLLVIMLPESGWVNGIVWCLVVLQGDNDRPTEPVIITLKDY